MQESPAEFVRRLQRDTGNTSVSALLVQRQTAAKGDAGSVADAGTQPDAGTPTLRVAGDPSSKKIIRVAWTFDDGPTEVTAKVLEKLPADLPITWYVMRNELEAGKKEDNFKALKARQDAGHEIAIHSMHKTRSHVAWIPRGSDNSYPTIDAALADLDAFYKELDAHGIHVKFGRLPGGEISELAVRLRKDGVTDPEGWGSKILKDEIGAAVAAKAKVPPGVVTLNGEFAKLRQKLDDLGMTLWGGAAKAGVISKQSWEAQSEPPEAVDPSIGVVDTLNTRFEGLVDELVADKSNRARSLVVLSHDTLLTDKGEKAGQKSYFRSDEFGRDLLAIEAYAKAKKVRLEYHPMSALHELVTGAKP